MTKKLKPKETESIMPNPSDWEIHKLKVLGELKEAKQKYDAILAKLACLDKKYAVLNVKVQLGAVIVSTIISAGVTLLVSKLLGGQ